MRGGGPPFVNKRCGLPLALPLHAKKLYRGLSSAGREKEARLPGRRRAFPRTPKSFKVLFLPPFKKCCLGALSETCGCIGGSCGGRSPGCTAWSGALYPPLDCWGVVWCPPSGDISVAASPPCVFCPDRRKARGARLPMSGFWGEGEFEGEGPLFTAGKRGHLPQSSQPGRSSMKQKWGRLLKRRPHFVSWELSLTPGSEAPVRRAQLRMRPLLPRPVPSCSALNGGRCVGRAFPRASGEGSLRRGPLVTAGKRGRSSSTYLCLRPALPWWPGRSAVPRWWG